jgi:AraC family transcriptional regulator
VLSARWNLEPEVSVEAPDAVVEAAIWSGSPREMNGVADPETHVLSLALGTYGADVLVNGYRRFSRIFSPGRAQLTPAGAEPGTVFRDPFRFLHLYLPASLVTRAATDLGLETQSLVLVDPEGSEDRELASLGHLVTTTVEQRLPRSALYLESLSLVTAMHLLRRWSNRAARAEQAQTTSAGQLAAWQLRRAIDLLNTRLADNVRLSELAGEVRLSPYHFARAFKASTGFAPHQYHLRLRLEKAREQLAATDLDVTAIAANVGYDDPGYLARIFRRTYGAAPLQYRRAIRS